MTTSIDMPEAPPAAYPEPATNEEENLLSVLSKESTVFAVTVGFPRFNKKLKPDELGLDESVLDPEKISLGSKKLLCSQRSELKPFELLEGEITSFLKDNSFPFMLKLDCVPNTNLEKVHAKLTEYEHKMSELSLLFVSRYHEIKSKAMEEWRDYALTCNAIKDPQAFLESIDKAFPPIDKVQDAFKFKWVTFTVKAPENIQLQLTTVSEQRAAADARNMVAQEAAVKLREETEGFLGSVVTSLRTECSTLLTEMLSSMEEGKLAVHQKTLNRLVKYIDKFRRMNFAGDEQLDQMLDGFEKEFLSMSAADLRGDEDAMASFKDALSNLSEQTKRLTEEDAEEIVSSFAVGKRKVVVD